MSATRPYVDAFADEMEAKLDANRHKGDAEGWQRESAAWLLERLKAEVAELESALAWHPCGCREACCQHDYFGRGAPSVTGECADVANFAMMIADVAGGLREQSK